MTIEADIFNTLKGLVGNRCFPDVAPITTAKPYVTYVQIGGEWIVYTDDELADKQKARFQVNVWADTRSSASAVMRQVVAEMVKSQNFQCRPVGGTSSGYDHDMLTYSSMQDFSVFS